MEKPRTREEILREVRKVRSTQPLLTSGQWQEQREKNALMSAKLRLSPNATHSSVGRSRAI